jgi:oligopeptide transport system substrate-binding protein
MKKQLLLVVSLIVVLGVFLSACSSSSKTSSSAGAGNGQSSSSNVKGPANNDITVDINDDFAHLDPALCYDVLCYEVVPQFYTRLIKYGSKSTKLVSDGADSWTISPDGKTYTFKLKQNIKFTNGDPVTAQSYIDEFKRILTPSVASPASGFINPLIVGSADFAKGKAKDISGITAPDKYTVKIQLTKPQGTFLDIISMPFFSAIDQSYVSSVGDKGFDHKPMGSGAYKMDSYQIGTQMVISKNSNYFVSGKPKFDKITLNVEKNQQTSALKFKQGQTAFIGWNTSLTSTDFVQMMNDPKYKNSFISQTLVSTEYLALNNRVKPFDNVKVRQAINYAVDKAKIVKLLNGRAKVTDQILPPQMPGYDQNLPANLKFSYDPAKAKALLKEAGYPNGFKTTLVTTTQDDMTKESQSIQSDLKAVGIDAQIRTLSSASWQSAAESLKYGIIDTAWFQDYPDPADFLDVLLNGNEIPSNNWSAYDNKNVNKELDQAIALPPGQPRWDAYQKIQNEILADAPWVPLYNPVKYVIAQPWIKGYYIHPVMQDPLDEMSIQH